MAWRFSLKNTPPLRQNRYINRKDCFRLTARKRMRERSVQHRRTPFTSLSILLSPPPYCRFRLDFPSPPLRWRFRLHSRIASTPLPLPLHWCFRLMAGIAHASLVSCSSPPSPVSAPCFSSRSSFSCASQHRHRTPESVDELTSLYNRRNHSILSRRFPIGRSLRFE
jgi:hypothetical protein